MSAQQREALSRGQMSIRTMPPRSIGPEPSSWPEADCAPWATIAVSGSSAPRPLQTSCMRSRTCSHVSPAGSSRSSSAAAPIAASAAACARRMPASWASVLRRRRRSKAWSSTVSVDPRAAQLVGPGEREVGRHERGLEPDLLARAQVGLDLGGEEVDAVVEQRVEPERERVDRPRSRAPAPRCGRARARRSPRPCARPPRGRGTGRGCRAGSRGRGRPTRPGPRA